MFASFGGFDGRGGAVMGRGLMPVGDFAKMARVTLATLHHYDKMGLLPPSSRGENNYRYYSLSQLSELNLIRTLQELGMSLVEIKALKDLRTPEKMSRVLSGQIEKIKEKMDGLASAGRLIEALLNSIVSAQGADEGSVTIQFLPAKPMVLGGWNDYAEGEDEYDALVRFYTSIRETRPGIDINYPVWGLFTKESLTQKIGGRRINPERYYFYAPDGQDERPPGLYAIGYARGGYGQNPGLYTRIWEYIDQNGFEISGDAYEEYPLNEISVADDANYLMRVMVGVRERERVGAYGQAPAP